MNHSILNSPLNIGLLAGFARMDGSTLRVFQSRYEALGFRLDLADDVRAPAFDYEPVLVAFRITRGRLGAPRMEALHVQRMPNDAFPRNGSKAWMRRKPYVKHAPDIEATTPNLPFNPYLRGGDPSPAVEALLSDRAEWPAWVQALIERNDLAATVFAYQESFGAGAFVGAWAGTGHLLQGKFEKGNRLLETGEGANFVWAEFGLGDNMALEDAITVLLPSPIPGFSRLRRLTLDRKEIHATLLVRLALSTHGAPSDQLGHLILNGKGIFLPSDEDREEAA